MSSAAQPREDEDARSARPRLRRASSSVVERLQTAVHRAATATEPARKQRRASMQTVADVAKAAQSREGARRASMLTVADVAEAAQARERARQYAQQVDAQPVRTHDRFHFERHAPGKRARRHSYHEQGSAVTHAKNLAARRKLAQQPAIAKAVYKFWQTAGLRDEQKMDRATYVAIYERVSRALGVTARADPADVSRKLAEDDWARDMRAHQLSEASGMPLDAFCAGLFELADVWTAGADETEYVCFLGKLYRRITRIVGVERVLRQSLPAALLDGGARRNSARPAAPDVRRLDLARALAHAPRAFVAIESVRTDAELLDGTVALESPNVPSSPAGALTPRSPRDGPLLQAGTPRRPAHAAPVDEDDAAATSRLIAATLDLSAQPSALPSHAASRSEDEGESSEPADPADDADDVGRDEDAAAAQSAAAATSEAAAAPAAAPHSLQQPSGADAAQPSAHCGAEDEDEPHSPSRTDSDAELLTAHERARQHLEWANAARVDLSRSIELARRVLGRGQRLCRTDGGSGGAAGGAEHGASVSSDSLAATLQAALDAGITDGAELLDGAEALLDALVLESVRSALDCAERAHGGAGAAEEEGATGGGAARDGGAQHESDAQLASALELAELIGVRQDASEAARVRALQRVPPSRGQRTARAGPAARRGSGSYPPGAQAGGSSAPGAAQGKPAGGAPGATLRKGVRRHSRGHRLSAAVAESRAAEAAAAAPAAAEQPAAPEVSEPAPTPWQEHTVDPVLLALAQHATEVALPSPAPHAPALSAAAATLVRGSGGDDGSAGSPDPPAEPAIAGPVPPAPPVLVSTEADDSADGSAANGSALSAGSATSSSATSSASSAHQPPAALRRRHSVERHVLRLHASRMGGALLPSMPRPRTTSSCSSRSGSVSRGDGECSEDEGAQLAPMPSDPLALRADRPGPPASPRDRGILASSSWSPARAPLERSASNAACDLRPSVSPIHAPSASPKRRGSAVLERAASNAEGLLRPSLTPPLPAAEPPRSLGFGAAVAASRRRRATADDASAFFATAAAAALEPPEPTPITRSRSKPASPTPAVHWQRSLAHFSEAASTAKAMSGKQALPPLQPISRLHGPAPEVSPTSSGGPSGSASGSVSFSSPARSRSASCVSGGSFATLDAASTPGSVSRTSHGSRGSAEDGRHGPSPGGERSGLVWRGGAAGHEGEGQAAVPSSPPPAEGQEAPRHSWLHELPDADPTLTFGLARAGPDPPGAHPRVDSTSPQTPPRHRPGSRQHQRHLPAVATDDHSHALLHPALGMMTAAQPHASVCTSSSYSTVGPSEKPRRRTYDSSG